MRIILSEMVCEISKELTTIHNSYLMDDEDIEDLIEKIIEIREEKKYKVTRSKNSYVKEVKAHNRLYKLGLFKSHTRDTDLEENIIWWKDIFYWVIGF